MTEEVRVFYILREVEMSKGAYPVILKKTGNEYYVEIPDFDTSTQGKDLVDAIEMARDAIGVMGISYEDKGIAIPEPNTISFSMSDGDIVTLVDVDFTEYRRKINNKAIKKNCTIPYWLSVEADKAGVNYSRVLQEALTSLLNVNYKYIY